DVVRSADFYPPVIAIHWPKVNKRTTLEKQPLS
ncbi:hypothetical protein JL09_g6163, partial [Pichia kudriavzevii]